jgi:hypothetical protein
MQGAAITRLQKAINTRLSKRGAASRRIKVDGQWGPKSRKALLLAANLLGAPQTMLDNIKTGVIGPRIQKFILSPGLRTAEEKKWGTQRTAKFKKAERKRAREHARANAKRKAICEHAKQAAANYRKNPGAYHYLAGGVANLIYLKPSPSNFRSDCSQFGAAVYDDCGLPSPASVPAQWASTFTMVKCPQARFVEKKDRKPGMLGMYGSRTAPHHVEIYIGEPDIEFIGHGSQPIDSLTPGQPDYYLDFDFLN